MRKIEFTLFALFVCALAGQAYEMREWEIKGQLVKGRFVRELFGKLTVEDDAGKQTTFGIEDLSDTDKKYVRVMIPPKIDVVARTKNRRLEKRPMALYRDDIEIVHQVTATITKESQRPFTSRLKAEIFLIAEEVDGDNYILLDRSEGDFILQQEKEYTYEFKSTAYKTTQFTDIGSGDLKGELYKGHVLLITSMQGELLWIDSNLPKWMQQPEFLEKMRELSVRGAPSVRSRHFDKSGDKVAPQRPRQCPLKTT